MSRNLTKEQERRELYRPMALLFLLWLNRSGKPMYQGTVPHAVKLRRRAAAKAARGARRAGRR